MGTYGVPPRNKKGSRTGYTTGSNAAAAAKAATIALLTGAWPEEVTITLPIGETATMTPVECHLEADAAFCCMVKDAGDDPDVTHGTLICARVQHSAQPGITLDGGEGVGRVTLPGLGLPVGDPAINPVPRRQICENVAAAVRAVCPEAADLEERGLEVVISVPEGVRLAQKTLNPRLGIVGGISILGTTGKVFPFSTAAWRASVVQAVEMAAHNAVTRVVLATGGRSERFAMQMFPELPEVAFVEISNFTGDGLKTCVVHGVKSVVLVAMIGKLIKTAQGHMTTHVAGNQVDFDFLAQICREVHAPADLVDAVAAANTGRHFLELCQAQGVLTPVVRLVELACENCEQFVQAQGGNLDVEVMLVDFDGTVLGRAARCRTADGGTQAQQPPLQPPLIQRLVGDASAEADE